jgi:hypothetical protein
MMDDEYFNRREAVKLNPCLWVHPYEHPIEDTTLDIY